MRVTVREADLSHPLLCKLPPMHARRIAARIPPEDRWLGDIRLTRMRLKAEAERRVAFAKLLMQPGNGHLRDWFARRCREDVAFFAENCVWTRDPERKVIPGVADLPFIPLTYMKEPIESEGRVWGGFWKLWDDALYDRGKWSADQEFPPPKRFAHEKGRRLRFSISHIIWVVHKFNFLPGFSWFLCTDTEGALDMGDDWNSLFGKFRHIQRHCHKYFPWLFVNLPKTGSSSFNKDKRVAYPPWIENGIPVNEACWSNEVLGYMASDAAGRGGAHLGGFVDEAGWIDEIEKFLDAIEDCTPMLVTGSTPPPDIHQTFAERRFGSYGYTVTTTHWTNDPVKCRGIRWNEHDQWGYLNPLCEHFRSPYSVEVLQSRPLHVYQRNIGLDYRSTSESPVLFTFQPGRQIGSTDPKAKDYDYFNPALPVIWTYDVGRADPWAWWAIQHNEETGEVFIIDFWMGAGMTVAWWIPMICGWDIKQRPNWKVAPEQAPWHKMVPWRYGPEDLTVMNYWRDKKREVTEWRGVAGLYRPGRFPERLIGDIQGKQRHGDSQYTVEQRLEHFGLTVTSASISNHMEEWLDHAREVLTRVKISGRLKGRHPMSQGVNYPSADEVIAYWKYMPATELGRPAKPIHDVYSHPGWALVYALRTFPAQVKTVRDGRMPEGRRVVKLGNRCYNTREIADPGIGYA